MIMKRRLPGLRLATRFVGTPLTVLIKRARLDWATTQCGRHWN